MTDEAVSPPAILKALEVWRFKVNSPSLSVPVRQSLWEFLTTNEVKLEVPASTEEISNWEKQHGYLLPEHLRLWLQLSNGLTINGSRWIHPLRSIGPTVRFDASSRILHQPDSWYEFGNPNDWPVNFNLLFSTDQRAANPVVFIANDRNTETGLRIIAQNFRDWFICVMENLFKPSDSGIFPDNLGDAFEHHYRNIHPPKLSPELCKICQEIGEKLAAGSSERSLMKEYQLDRHQLEQVVDAFQYRREKRSSAG